MKKEIRLLGIDDAPFDKRKDKKVLVVGAVFRGGDWMDGVLSTWITRDGNDATRKIISMINKCRFKPQLNCILLDGIAVGGFNVIDVNKLSKAVKKPVIIVVRNYPDLKQIKEVLQKLGMQKKIELIDAVEPPVKVGKIYIQPVNISLEKAEKILKLSSTRSFLPEPIRTAHLIGAGIIKGESKGRA